MPPLVFDRLVQLDGWGCLQGTDAREIRYKVETELEADGCWIAEIVDVPGVMAYGATEREAVESAKALALRILAGRIEQ